MIVHVKYFAPHLLCSMCLINSNCCFFPYCIHQSPGPIYLVSLGVCCHVLIPNGSWNQGSTALSSVLCEGLSYDLL